MPVIFFSWGSWFISYFRISRKFSDKKSGSFYMTLFFLPLLLKIFCFLNQSEHLYGLIQRICPSVFIVLIDNVSFCFWPHFLKDFCSMEFCIHFALLFLLNDNFLLSFFSLILGKDIYMFILHISGKIHCFCA